MPAAQDLSWIKRAIRKKTQGCSQKKKKSERSNNDAQSEEIRTESLIIPTLKA
jgi:hypothetical protein